MAYQDNFVNHLNDIIDLLKNGKVFGANEALDKFRAYIQLVQAIGSFDVDNWREDWRKKIWKLGEEFKNKNPQRFIDIIDAELAAEIPRSTREPLEFIRSEIAFNYLPDIECKKIILTLIEKYPLNPEFRHTLGHYYSREGKLLESANEYKLAYKIDPKNHSFLQNRFAKEQSYLNELIRLGEYQKGLDYLKNLTSETEYQEAGGNIRTTFVDYHRRLSDHILFQEKIIQLEKDFRERMVTELSNERKRIIEIVGFFSAIVAFILSTVSIGRNFSFIEALYFIISLGIVLILFSITISVLFTHDKKNVFKDKIFWILIVSLFILFLFIWFSGSIAEIVCRS